MLTIFMTPHYSDDFKNDTIRNFNSKSKNEGFRFTCFSINEVFPQENIDRVSKNADVSRIDEVIINFYIKIAHSISFWMIGPSRKGTISQV